MYFRTEGVILKKRNFGEADRILSIFTKDHGKISALAKSVRRPRSKKAGHLEIGSWCKIFVAQGKNIDLLTEVELKRAFGIADFTESKANRIYHLLELVESLTADSQKNINVFILLIHFLKRIEKHDDFNLISALFKIKLLSILGYFSAKSFKTAKNRELFSQLQNRDFDDIKTKFSFSKNTYLKLIAFLDSMIENVTQQKLKTVRFL